MYARSERLLLLQSDINRLLELSGDMSTKLHISTSK